MTTEISSLADTLLAGGAIQILAGLAILRFALGLTDVVVGLAVAIIAFSIALSSGPIVKPGIAAPTTNAAALNLPAPKKDVEAQLRVRLAQSQTTGAPAATSLPLLSGAALRTQVAIADLQRGLLWGVKLLIPFLLIDLLVAHIFTVLQWSSLPAQSITVPFKLIVFLTIGGWPQIVAWLNTAALVGYGL